MGHQRSHSSLQPLSPPSRGVRLCHTESSLSSTSTTMTCCRAQGTAQRIQRIILGESRWIYIKFNQKLSIFSQALSLPRGMEDDLASTIKEEAKALSANAAPDVMTILATALLRWRLQILVSLQEKDSKGTLRH